ncbi:protein sel-1 homolog 3 [Patella vulgata]|uniref:protein sel-1 homolog 3 n=1 Tax=Patella vulgata TaxID=6465 RepID=UPI00217FFD1A|nr:protein sel-1 homolog 3 [Patella vulgata]
MANTIKLNMEVLCVYILVFIFLPQVFSKDPETISVVIDKTDSLEQEYIQIMKPPTYIDSLSVLTLEYRCPENSVVGVEVVIHLNEINSTIQTPHRYWKCSQNYGLNKKKKIRIKIPDAISFRPSISNKVYYRVFTSKLRAWIINKTQFEKSKDKQNVYVMASTKASYDVRIHEPYSRRMIKPWKACPIWYWRMLNRIPDYVNKLSCEKEEEVVKVVSYPTALNGRAYGIYRSFEPYKSPVLESERLKKFHNPTFTISMWVYILEYCPNKGPNGRRFCSLVMHSDWKRSKTPCIILTPDGSFQIEVWFKDGSTSAMKPHFILPRHQWFRLTLSFMYKTWLLTVNHGKNRNETFQTYYTYDKELFMDDTTGYFVFGGNENSMPTILGYIGETKYYRRKYMLPTQIPYPSPYHPMFELGLTHREEKCAKFINWIDKRVEVYKRLTKSVSSKDVCQSYFNELLKSIHKSSRVKQCSVERSPRPRYYRIVNSFIKRSALKGKTVSHKNMTEVADQLYNNATSLIEVGLTKIPRVVPLLKQSSCLGNTDAMFMLAVILNNGVYVKSDEIQGQAYLMMASMEGNILASLALAHKHMFGIDGVPFDKPQAYMYYKFVADKTRDDIEEHKSTNVLTEFVRLTDEATLQKQTDEEGDVFLWLKHQAQSGVLSAQRHVARSLFWGSQGLKRNIDAAMSYFREGAATKNPNDMYDYGILLYKGSGSNKNQTEGKKMMEQAAEKLNPNAMSALGWIAMRERNYTKAATLFDQAHKRGSMDGGYYLGIMLMHGLIPNKPVDMDLAKIFFIGAAKRGHIDAGVQFALISMKGTAINKRNVHIATEWARHIAEKNPGLGHILHKALHFYRQMNMPQALFYYMMAADTGTEVASFNLAYLCEENKEGMVHLIEKECQWRNYNMTIQREIQFVSSYSLIKMGDYHWYGCQADRNIEKAAKYYGLAANKGDPHALFNIAMMVEEGVTIPDNTWTLARVGTQHRIDNMTLLTHLYSRCKESRKTEAYLPCTIALFRIQFMDLWTRYHIWMKLSSIIGIAVFTTMTFYTVCHHFRHRRQLEDTV